MNALVRATGNAVLSPPARGTLADLLREVGLHAEPRGDNTSAWDALWTALAHQPVWYDVSMLDYQLSYLRGAGEAIDDLSLTLHSGGQPCAVWPLTLARGAGGGKLSSAGAAIVPPLFLPGQSAGTVKRICARALALLSMIARRYCVGSLDLQQPALPNTASDGATEWHRQIMAMGAGVTAFHELYTDLRPSLTEIRAKFRKSYRPLINVGLRNWNVFLLDREHPDARAWTEFKQLHFQAAGRSTRDDRTWALQFEMLASGRGFLVGLREPATGRLVGAGFFQYTRDEGLYAVAAYDRNLFAKPLGHVVQQRAIETMKNLGLTWYRIGERQYPQDIPAPTEKQLAIAEFKQGFASHIFCRYVFRLAANAQTRSSTPQTE